jgi:tRNA pseudouridine38-40 synthase
MPDMDNLNRPPSGPEGRRFALLTEYDGTDYAGSQLQTNAPTIQGALEAAILKVTGEQVRAAFAGRTDAGVHAYAQVAAFTSQTRLPPQTLRNALNARLPADIAVKGVAVVDSAFDPRRDAVRRRYVYAIENVPVRPAIGRKYSWYLPYVVDEDAMDAAASALIGEHDFAAFGGTPEEPGASTVRRLDGFFVMREGTKLLMEVSGNAFLRGMVRRMVGALVDVGLEKITPRQYLALLKGAPSSAGPAAPAHGLYLLEVEYPESPFDAVASSPEG